MESITVNGFRYYLGSELMTKAPIFSIKCKIPRDYRNQDVIPASECIFIKNVKGTWIVTDGKNKRYDVIAIKKDYVDNSEIIQQELNEEQVYDSNGFRRAPKILTLEDDEKIYDNDGNFLEIEIRGEQETGKIYFKVNDISKFLELKKLYIVITNTGSSYKRDEHYVYFLCEQEKIRKTQKCLCKELFLTFSGFMRLIHSSQSPKMQKYINWANDMLFVVMMGSKERKAEIADKLLGTTAKNVIDVYNTNTDKFPVLYLFTLGYVKNLRKSMKIDAKYDDDMIICIYGRTRNIARRTGEHKNFYRNTEGVVLRLKNSFFVDPQFLPSAENEIKQYVKDLKCKFTYKKEAEMIILHKDQLKMFKEKYKQISEKYMCDLTNYSKQLEHSQHKNDVLNLTYEKDTLKLQNKLTIEKQRHEINNLKNERTIDQLQHRIKHLEKILRDHEIKY